MKVIMGIGLVCLCAFSFLVIIEQTSSVTTPLFYMDLLTPNTNLNRIMWSELIASELPQIGIGIGINNFTGWAGIMPRTWSYPVGVDYDYIPTYADGGFDALFV